MIVLLLLASYCQAKVTDYLTGNPQDVNPQLHGPAHDFAGGGGDLDEAYQWMFDQVRGCSNCKTKLDVIVLRASGSNDYNDYLYHMKGVDSVETLIITSPKDAETEFVLTRVRNAEIIFFAGGDQCNYVKNVKGTKLQRAIESVYKRGGGIGGTSAGYAIQGDITFDSCVDTTYSKTILADPYDRTATFTYNFFHWENMQNTFPDTHFRQRDRLGRLLGFLARQIQDGKTSSVLGMGVDARTTLAVDKNGIATVIGKGPAYFILADHPPEVCKPKTPLTYSDYKIWKLNRGQKFDLKHRPTTGFYLRSVVNGKITADPYEP